MEELVKKVPSFKESRLPSLYSDFTQLRELNPEGFSANVDAWCSLLLQGLKSHFFKSSVSITSSGLATMLTHPKYGEPKALGLLLDELVRSKKYIPLSLYKDTSPYTSRSIADYVSPMKWLSASWASVKLSSFKSSKAGTLLPETYIHIDNLAAVGDKIARLVQEKVDSEGVYSSRLLDGEMFAAVVRQVHEHISNSDIEVLHTYISRDAGKMKLVKQNSKSDRIYIKFGTTAISEDDISIIKLKSSIHNLSSRSKVLEHRLDIEIPERIRGLLKVKDSDRQERLRNILIQKAQVKKSLSKCEAVSNKLNSLLEAVNDAQGNASLFETLQSTKSALQSLNGKVSLDELDVLQSELDDEIAATNTISDSLIVSTDGIDEGEVDDELERLEKEEMTKKARESAKEKEEEKSESDDVYQKLENLNIQDAHPPEAKSKKPEPQLLHN